MPVPIPKEQAHPLYSTNGKKHYEAPRSNEFEWKPSVKTNNEVLRKDPRHSSVKIMNPNFT